MAAPRDACRHELWSRKEGWRRLEKVGEDWRRLEKAGEGGEGRGSGCGAPLGHFFPHVPTFFLRCPTLSYVLLLLHTCSYVFPTVSYFFHIFQLFHNLSYLSCFLIIVQTCSYCSTHCSDLFPTCFLICPILPCSFILCPFCHAF